MIFGAAFLRNFAFHNLRTWSKSHNNINQLDQKYVTIVILEFWNCSDEG